MTLIALYPWQSLAVFAALCVWVVIAEHRKD